MKGEVVADSIFGHMTTDEENIIFVGVCPWKNILMDRFIETDMVSAMF
jgi:hypothetical protein